jgi:hypothetical protein
MLHKERMKMSPITPRNVVLGKLAIYDASDVAIHTLVSSVQTERDGNVLSAKKQAGGECRVGAIGCGAHKPAFSQKTEGPLGFGDESG